MKHRRTKIIATLGPSTDDVKTMERLVDAGVDLVRLNFSHGTLEEHKWRAETIRRISAEKRYQVGILGDLQGAKIRIGRFENDKITLQIGDTFRLNADLDLAAGNQQEVGFTYKNLVEDVSAGDTLLLADGRIALQVEQVDGGIIETIVLVGGELSNNKGINKKGGGLSAAALTEKDLQDIKHAAELDLDYLAVSFPKAASDIRRARELLRESGSEACIVAKIERSEALDHIDEILEASDAIMIARGDLGVEIGDAEVPGVQKSLIMRAQQKNCVAITATQMMESMVSNPIPTRAEVSDVANAVLDGTDAVMLSEETAAGNYPVESVKAMHRTCNASEKQELRRFAEKRASNLDFERVDQAISMSAMYMANHLNVAAIASLTESGSTALWMSRINSSIPIYALTRHVRTLRRVTLYRGVYPAPLNYLNKTHSEVNHAAVKVLMRRKEVVENDLVILTKGDLMGVDGGTNAMKVLRVGHMVES